MPYKEKVPKVKEKSSSYKMNLLRTKLEKNFKLYREFSDYLDKQDLDIEFVLYEDSYDYPDSTLKIYNKFLKERKH